MTETESYIHALEGFNFLMEPAARAAIEALHLPLGSRGLDAGCGVGLQALPLAAAVGPSGHAIGLDIAPEMLRHGETIVRRAGMAGRISFRKGDVRNLPFDSAAFDWAWSSCCVGYASFLDPVPTLGEMARVVKPGGTVAILVWSSESLLPGYPRLEARLRATSPGIAPHEEEKGPESHFLRAMGWFRELGLLDPKSHTVVVDAYAPLSDEVRTTLASLVDMRWPGAESELVEADREAYRRLCLPDSPDFILDHPDYYAFFTCTLFYAKVPI